MSLALFIKNSDVKDQLIVDDDIFQAIIGVLLDKEAQGDQSAREVLEMHMKRTSLIVEGVVVVPRSATTFH